MTTMASELTGVLPAILIAGPMLGAAVVMIAGRVAPRWFDDALAMVVALGSLAGGCWLTGITGGGRIVEWIGDWQPRHGQSVGIVLVADRMSAGMVVIIAGLMVAVLTYSWHFLEEVDTTYHALLLCFLASMTGFALAGDLFDAFVWFEMMGVVAYALVGMRVEEPRSVHGALGFGIVNTLGASVSLVGVTFLYARTGELNLAAVGRALRAAPTDRLVTVACVFLMSGVLVKAAAVPFHFWTADAEAVAPTPVCALLSGAMVALGVFAVARWWWVVFAGVVDTASMRHALVVLGAVTAVIGGIMCFSQRHIKRLLAYSTVSHVGVFLIGVGLLNGPALAATGLYVAGHACAKAALFLGSGVLLNRFESVDEHELFGRGRALPGTGLIFAVGGLALAGLPPLGTWLGKTLLEEAASSAGATWVVPIILAASVLTGGAVLRVTARVFLGLGPRPEDAGKSRGEQPEAGPFRMLQIVSLLGPGSVLLAASVALAAVPAVRSGAATAAAAFVDTPAYVAQVLGLGSPGPAAAAAEPVWTGSGVGFGLAAAAAAVVVACLGIWAGSLPVAVRRLFRPARVVITGLHAVHEAHVGEYVGWLMVGVAALGCALVF